jgi:hypothetical protein
MPRAPTDHVKLGVGFADTGELEISGGWLVLPRDQTRTQFDLTLLPLDQALSDVVRVHLCTVSASGMSATAAVDVALINVGPPAGTLTTAATIAIGASLPVAFSGFDDSSSPAGPTGST